MHNNEILQQVETSATCICWIASETETKLCTKRDCNDLIGESFRFEWLWHIAVHQNIKLCRKINSHQQIYYVRLCSSEYCWRLVHQNEDYFENVHIFAAQLSDFKWIGRKEKEWKERARKKENDMLITDRSAIWKEECGKATQILGSPALHSITLPQTVP